jgi:uncharacterized protein
MRTESVRAVCPICGQPSRAEFAPFCSRRCADVDLGRWLTGSYRLPGLPAEREDESPAGEAS